MNSLHLHKPKQRTKNPKKSEKMYKVKEHGWAEKLAGCLSKQQLSKTAPHQGNHSQNPSPYTSFGPFFAQLLCRNESVFVPCLRKKPHKWKIGLHMLRSNFLY